MGEWFEKHKHEIYPERTPDELLVSLRTDKMSVFINYFIKKVLCDAKYRNNPLSPNDFFQNDKLIKEAFDYIKKNMDRRVAEGDVSFFEGKNEVEDIEKYLRIGPLQSTVVRKISNMNPLIVKHFMNKYTTIRDSVYLDPCCGWGVRLSVAVKRQKKYIGFEVNHNLVIQLNKMKDFFVKYLWLNPNRIMIYEESSANEKKELFNTADFIFTSPPYFDDSGLVEVYTPEQEKSYKKLTREEWNNTFTRPMLRNCFNYLKDGKYAIFNVDKFSIEDYAKIGMEVGFKLWDIDYVQHGKVTGSKRNAVPEPAVVLKKTSEPGKTYDQIKEICDKIREKNKNIDFFKEEVDKKTEKQLTLW